MWMHQKKISLDDESDKEVDESTIIIKTIDSNKDSNIKLEEEEDQNEDENSSADVEENQNNDNDIISPNRNKAPENSLQKHYTETSKQEAPPLN